MSARPITVCFDATYSPAVKIGGKVRRGQRLCRLYEGINPPASPVSGIVQNVRFEPGDHTFVITILPAPAS